MFLMDGHCDILNRLVMRRDWDLRYLKRGRQWDIPKLRKGGVSLQVCAVFTAEYAGTPGLPLHRGLEMVELAHAMTHRFPDTFTLVTESKQINKVRRAGKKALVLSIEGAEAIDGSLEILRLYHRLGVRAMGFAWNHPNPLATGCLGRRRAPLTPLGRQALRLMDELGMVVDVAHLNEGGFWEVVERCRHPFVASHANARALCDHPRNLDDRQLKALARRGGVIGVVFYPPFLRVDGKAAVEDVVRHIDYLVSLIGVDQVGFGSDFEGIHRTPRGLSDVSCYPDLLDALNKRGYRSADLAKIAGENFLRVFSKVF
jgi:membrane dipeptidase